MHTAGLLGWAGWPPSARFVLEAEGWAGWWLAVGTELGFSETTGTAAGSQTAACVAGEDGGSGSVCMLEQTGVLLVSHFQFKFKK